MKKSNFVFAFTMFLFCCLATTSCTKDHDVHPTDKQEMSYEELVYGTADDITEPKKKRKKR